MRARAWIAVVLLLSCHAKPKTLPPVTPPNAPEVTVPPRIYQLFVRLFGNTNGTNAYDGTAAINGVGKFADINDAALTQLQAMGITHLWLTGVVRQATLTDYSTVNPALGADVPDIAKGRAGSPYAIKDYYDVSPDLAVDPAQRIAEFQSLLQRIHAHGLKALIDFVPNHVSRAYASTVQPSTTFGAHDDRTQFFTPNNNFFYLVSPAGQALHLTYPPGAPPRQGLTGTFPAEDGTAASHVPKTTGDNQTSPSPLATDWYEAIKLNYGFNFVDGSTHYDPMPSTWTQMDAILAYWQALGVDGFRCDFAHWIPVEFWTWAIGRAKARQSAYFFAEAYNNSDAAPGFSPAAFVKAGFDALYDYNLYNGVKAIFASGKWCNDLDALLPDPSVEGHLLRYAENHDECRIAAPIIQGDPGNSGFGSKEEGFAVTALLQALGPDATLLYNGQEIGEPGAGNEGFSGEDGRTSIFDYWTMPEFAKWVNGHAYDGALLAADQQGLRASYAALTKLLAQPAFAEGAVYSLQTANKAAVAYGGMGQWVYGFLRYQPDVGQTYLVLINLDPANGYQPVIRVPTEAMNLARLPPSGSTLTFTDALSPLTASVAAQDLSTLGVEIDLPPLTVRMLLVTAG